MRLIIHFTNDINAEIKTLEIDNTNWETINRFVKDIVPIESEVPGSLVISWKNFLACKNELAKLARIYGIEIILTEEAKEQIRVDSESGYFSAVKRSPENIENIISVLSEKKWRQERMLTPEQQRNVCRLAALPAGATFSVPGAGKTTEALAYYFFHANEEDKLLVVAPKNAFPAWEEQLDECVNGGYKFKRLTGGYSNIEAILESDPRFMLIAYKQLSLVEDIIIEHLRKSSVFMFLDESHRIKGGSGKKTVDSVLKMAFLPTRKLIMSGTPMPQSEQDLDPQIHFLYPELGLQKRPSIELIKPIYVRTTKTELGLTKPIRSIISVFLTGPQLEFYNLLKSETMRQMMGITRFNRANLRRIGRSVIKLMQFVSNPSLLAKDILNNFSEELSQILVDGGSVKVDYACKRARELAKEGKKTIIWTSFVKNVELIAMRLEDIGADYIHGGVEAGDDTEEETREGKIKRFHDDENAMVLVANPAAAAEGISLHKVCHTAIYVDRTFNAAQYLQSEDRIHRLGLPKNVTTNIEILECKNTIDEVIKKRLEEKVARMGEVLNDSSLNISADEYIFEEDDILGITGIGEKDAELILSYLLGGVYD